MARPRQDVQDPLTVAGAIIGVKYDGGIILASDTVITYGTALQFTHVSHFHQLTPTTVIGASGEVADFQELIDILQSYLREAECANHGRPLLASEVYNLIKRIMYTRRSRIDPLVMQVVVAGINADGSSLLAAVDLYGTFWEDDFVCGGMAAYLKGLQLDRAAGHGRDEVIAAIKQVWAGLARRSVGTNLTVEFIDVSPAGITRLEAVRLELPWYFAEATGFEDETEC
jgi:20S proteasome alpha/beta subunit